MQGDMAALHYCLHGDREILAAHFLGATEYTRALGLVGMTYDTAMRTNRAVGPQKTFEEFAGRFVIAEMGSRENVHVVTCLDDENTTSFVLWCQRYNRRQRIDDRTKPSALART